MVFLEQEIETLNKQINKLKESCCRMVKSSGSRHKDIFLAMQVLEILSARYKCYLEANRNRRA
jgi:hypothetical protein